MSLFLKVLLWLFSTSWRPCEGFSRITVQNNFLSFFFLHLTLSQPPPSVTQTLCMSSFAASTNLLCGLLLFIHLQHPFTSISTIFPVRIDYKHIPHHSQFHLCCVSHIMLYFETSGYNRVKFAVQSDPEVTAGQLQYLVYNLLWWMLHWSTLHERKGDYIPLTAMQNDQQNQQSGADHVNVNYKRVFYSQRNSELYVAVIKSTFPHGVASLNQIIGNVYYITVHLRFFSASLCISIVHDYLPAFRIIVH